jgi:hypothetical protein
MLHVMPAGVVVNAVPPVITFGTAVSDVDPVNRATYTFSLGTGTAATDRGVIIAVGVGGGGTGVVTGVTVDGNGASQLLLGTLDNEVHSGLFYRALPTGTSSTFVVSCTPSPNKGHCGIVVLPVYGAAGTAYDTLFSATNPGTGTIDVSAGGIIVGYQVVSNATDRTFSWTGLDNAGLDEQPIEVNQTTHSFAASVFTEAEVGRTITCTPSGATSLGENLVVVSMSVAA